jgi:hypothetical protein
VRIRVVDTSNATDAVATPDLLQFGEASKPVAREVERPADTSKAKRVKVAEPVEVKSGLLHAARAARMVRPRPDLRRRSGDHGKEGTIMAIEKDMNIVAEIKKRHGSVIDLDKSPTVIIEIIHNFRYLLDEVAGPDGTAGGPPGRRLDPGQGGGEPTLVEPGEVGTAAVLNLLLEVKRDVESIKAGLHK